MLKTYGKHIALFQKLLEAAMVFAVWMLSYFLRFHVFDSQDLSQIQLFVNAGILLSLMTSYFYHRKGLYKAYRLESRRNEAFTILKVNSLALLFFTVFLYFFAEIKISRISIITYFTLSNFILIGYRMVLRTFLRRLRRQGKNLRFAVLVGHGQTVEEYVKRIQGFKDSGIRFMGWLDSEGLAAKYKIPELTGNIINLKNKIPMDFVVVSYSNQDANKIGPFLKDNFNDVVPFMVLPDLTYSYLGYSVSHMAGMPALSVNQPDFSTVDIIAKRIFDIVTTGIGLIFISPLLSVVAILIRLESKGPIFYGQERVGLDGEKFKMWKFRSMRIGAEYENGSSQPGWTVKDDPRVTLLGKFLRSTSIDELPQLWNVFVGDMSLVGPRPERDFFVQKFRNEIPAYMLRHKMKSGITGWAQINGWRGDTSIQKRVECDLYYINNWSIWLDLKIIFMTFTKGFVNKNAY